MAKQSLLSFNKNSENPMPEASNSKSKKRSADDGSGDESEPSGKKVATPKGEDSDSDSKVAGWLNGLASGEAEQLHRSLSAKVGIQTVCQLSDADVTLLRGATNKISPNRNGDWYIKWASCEVLSLSKGKNGTSHPRYQIDIGASRSSSLINLVKSAVDVPKFEAFQGLAEGKGKTAARQVKMLGHHVAYNSSPARATAPIPLNSGHGGSISHLCDYAGCVKQDHLKSEKRHADNMARQRCSGVLLLLYNRVIIMESPCEHGKGEGTGEAEIALSCRRARLVELTDEIFSTMQEIKSVGGLD